MKSELPLSEWKSAEVAVSPHETFTLWLIHDGLCKDLTDFKNHFGDELDPAVSKLEQDGFIIHENRGLLLTEAGQRIISYLTHEEREQEENTEFKAAPRKGPMPKGFKGQDLRGRNFKNQDLRGAVFSGAAIGGAKFTSAKLMKAKFIGAQTGVEKPWMALSLCICISFVLCSLLDFVGILFAVVFTTFLLPPNFPEDTGIFPYIEMSVIQLGIYVIFARQGFTAKALTRIPAFVVFFVLIVAGPLAIALTGAVAVGVGVVGTAALAGAGAVAFAGALALALAPALALAGAVTSAGVFVLAFALADALAFAFAPAFARADAIAREMAGAVDSAGALARARAVASAIALAALLLSLYVARRSSKEDEKFEPGRSLGLWLGVLGGTSFQTADLSDADFSGATLNNCDFSGATVTRTRFKDAKQLKRARLKDTILNDNTLRDLLVTGQGLGQNYQGKNLQGANLAKAKLQGADFTEADLSGATLAGADLNGAWLIEADLSGATLAGADLNGAWLTKTQALGADFSGAKLTGACIEGWNIDAHTRFDGVECDYIFQSETPNAKGVRERLPHNPDKIFQPGDFEKLFKTFMDTVKLLFHNGVDRDAFNAAFDELMRKFPEITLDSIQAIERKGNDVLVTLQVTKDADTGAIEKVVDENYRPKLKLPAKNLAINIIGGKLIMGDTYKVGQAGAVGPGAHVHEINQVWNESSATIDIARLARELKELRDSHPNQTIT